MSMGITLICRTCGQPFTVKPSRVGKRVTCSPACRDTRIEVPCEWCGKPLVRPAWHRRMSKHFFCDADCRASYQRANRVLGYPVLFDRLEQWSPDMAYWLGLMITDGHVSEDGPVGFVSLDRELTEFVREFICPESPIREEVIKSGKTAYRWSVWSVRLRDMLAPFGIIPKKSTVVRMPPVPDDVLWDFVRGILDGNGHVDRAGRVDICTGSLFFADDLAAVFAAQGWNVKRYTGTRSFRVDLNVSSSRELAALMYRRGPCLERKRLKFR